MVLSGSGSTNCRDPSVLTAAAAAVAAVATAAATAAFAPNMVATHLLIKKIHIYLSSI
jgi:hypothetical protein